MRQIITITFLIVTILFISCEEKSTTNNSNNTLEKKEYISANTSELIRNIIEQGKIEGYTEKLAAKDFLDRFYKSREYRTAWNNISNINDALSSIKELENDGLNPEFYHYTQLKEMTTIFKNSPLLDALLFAKFDVLLTDAYAVAAAHLISGKVNPETLEQKWETKPKSYKTVFDNPELALQEALENNETKGFLNNLKPSHYMYTGLKKALAEYREYKESGGWDSIQSGATIKLGDKSERVIQVRSRLYASNEMEAYSPVNDSVYDSILHENMKLFQKKYGIDVDGNVGKQTLYELNLSVNFRINQIKANLERARWVLYEIEKKFIAVNIAGFELYFIEDDKEILTSKVIVGKNHTKTPIFKDTMSYVVINPTWTVPRSLYPKYIDKLHKDPDYFAEKNMEVITFNGEIVSIENTDWSKYSTSNFPYMVRQKAGPTNALGYIKCMFPNAHSVYIHDTPARSLFSKDKRAFSHGCIRTHKIREVAQLLLEPYGDDWTAEKIDQIIETRKTTTIALKEKVPVLLLYWTAGIGFNKNFYFKPDIYKRDLVLIEALNTMHDY